MLFGWQWKRKNVEPDIPPKLRSLRIYRHNDDDHDWRIEVHDEDCEPYLHDESYVDLSTAMKASARFGLHVPML